jgi:uncharacterized protein (DUF433 family)
MAASVIVRDPEILGGMPCFRSTQVPFQTCLITLKPAIPSTNSWNNSRP